MSFPHSVQTFGLPAVTFGLACGAGGGLGASTWRSPAGPSGELSTPEETGQGEAGAAIGAAIGPPRTSVDEGKQPSNVRTEMTGEPQGQT